MGIRLRAVGLTFLSIFTLSGCFNASGVSWTVTSSSTSETANTSESTTSGVTIDNLSTLVGSSSVPTFNVFGTCTGEGNAVNLSGAFSDSVTCTAGAWSYTTDISGVSEGSFTVTATHLDANGNNATTSKLFDKDSLAPIAPTLTPSSGTYVNASNDSAFYLSGTCESGATVNLTGGVTTSVTCTSGTWGTAIDVSGIPDNTNAITITASQTDTHGNVSTGVNASYHKDTNASVTLSTPSDGSYATVSDVSSFAVSGTCSDNGSTLTVEATDGTTTLSSNPGCTSNVFSTHLDLSSLDDGDNNITVTVDLADPAGNVATTSSVIIGKDITSPTVSIVTPTIATIINNSLASSLSLSGSCSEEGDTVSISGSASGSTTCSGGSWSTAVDVSSASDGTSTVTITASQTDAAGNTGSDTKTYNKDTQAPTANTVAINSDAEATNSTAVTLTLTSAGVDKMYITNTSGCTSGGTWETFSSSKAWTLSDTQALNTVYVKFRDTAFNETSCISAQIYQEEVTVEKVYPNNSNWNDYIRNAAPANPFYAQADTACTSASINQTDCYHSGPMRKVVVTGYTCTDNIAVTDTLNVFEWHCVTSGSDSHWYSVTLSPNKRLADLVTATSWKDIGVVVSGDINLASVPRPWWNNPVVPLPDNSGGADIAVDLTDTGKIYTLTTSRATHGYRIVADKIAVVLFNGVKLNYYGLAGGSGGYNCNSVSGVGTSNTVCVLAAGASSGFRMHLWVEGIFSGKPWPAATAANYGVLLASTKFSRLYKTKALQASSNGIRLISSHANYLYNVDSVQNGGDGLYVLGSSSHNVIHGSKFNNNGFSGIHNQAASSNVYSKILTANNGSFGVNLGSTLANSENVLNTLTSVNNLGGGLKVSKTQGNDFQNLVLFHNGTNGMYVCDTATTSNVSDNSFIGLASANNLSFGMTLCMHNGKFSGATVLGNNPTSNCNVTGTSVNPGITNSTCALQAPSDGATPVTSADLSSSFYALVGTDDGTNSESASIVSLSSLTDWFRFDNFFRAWGIKPSAFPDASAKGNCTTGFCQIYDWQLLSADGEILNRSLNGASANPAFSTAGTCGSHIDGNDVTVDQASTPRTFLTLAVETLGDFKGNDNGLCESGESCLYTPNFGAYQGHGSETSCVISNGALTNIKIYSYSANGI